MLKHQAFFHFSGNLNDFLPDEKKGRRFVYNYKGIASVKNLIEAVGVPHSEIRKITVNHFKKKLDYSVRDNDSVRVFAYNHGINKFCLILLSVFTGGRIKFIIDVHLGKLGKYLRICGFDVLYNWKWDDSRIIKEALKQKRIILTHDKGLLKNKKVINGYWVRSLDPEKQIVEVIERYHLRSKIKPFKKCLHCSCQLEKIAKKKIRKKVPLPVYNKYRFFLYCKKCRKIYWKGDHYESMMNFINKLKSR